MWSELLTWWAALNSTVQGAILSGCFTAVTATVGVAVVVLQLRGQAKNAEKSNRHGEGIKLRKDVYLEVLPEIKEAENARAVLSTFVTGFTADVHAAPVYRSNGHTGFLPSARMDIYIKSSTECGEKLRAIPRVVDRWQIIDLRLRVFRTAFRALQYDLNAVEQAYHNIAIIWFPRGNDPTKWSPPTGADLEKFIEISEDYQTVLLGAAAILSDFKAEMQNVLLGEMFKPKVPARKPPEGSRYLAVELDKHKELEAYYSAKGKWGNQAMSFYRRQTSAP